MFSMCSELTPRARIPDTRIPQLMQPWQAMDYINSKVPCIKFLPKVESSPSFVTISDRGDSCSSALGRVGGEQELKLSRRDDVTTGK